MLIFELGNPQLELFLIDGARTFELVYRIVVARAGIVNLFLKVLNLRGPFLYSALPDDFLRIIFLADCGDSFFEFEPFIGPLFFQTGFFLLLCGLLCGHF